MAEPLSAQIIRQLPQVANLYHRLLLVTAPSGAGKTTAMQEVAEQIDIRYINVNVELSPYRSLILETSSKIWKFSFRRDNDFNS